MIDKSPASRDQLHSAFDAWLDRTRCRLKVGIVVTQSTSHLIEFGFRVANSILLGSITGEGDLEIAVEWAGECWDFLMWNEARPKQGPEGIVCDICESEGKRRIFASYEALWIDHLFLPLETWVNVSLATSDAVAVYDHDGCTSARLVTRGDDVGNPAYLIQL